MLRLWGRFQPGTFEEQHLHELHHEPIGCHAGHHEAGNIELLSQLSQVFTFYSGKSTCFLYGIGENDEKYWILRGFSLERYNKPPWITCERESKEMLSMCLKKIKGLNRVKLIDAAFVWTESHSRRIKVKLTIQKEVRLLKNSGKLDILQWFI